MNNDDDPIGPRRFDPVTPPSPSDATPVNLGTRLRDGLVLGVFAVTAGGVVLVVAVAWGAAEAAVGVGAAYLVYNAMVGGPDVSGALAVRLLTMFRAPPAPPVPD